MGCSGTGSLLLWTEPPARLGELRIRGSGATSLTFGRAMSKRRNLEGGFPRFGSPFLTGKWWATIELIWSRFSLAHSAGM